MALSGEHAVHVADWVGGWDDGMREPAHPVLQLSVDWCNHRVWSQLLQVLCIMLVCSLMHIDRAAALLHASLGTAKLPSWCHVRVCAPACGVVSACDTRQPPPRWVMGQLRRQNATMAGSRSVHGAGWLCRAAHALCLHVLISLNSLLVCMFISSFGLGSS